MDKPQIGEYWEMDLNREESAIVLITETDHDTVWHKYHKGYNGLHRSHGDRPMPNSLGYFCAISKKVPYYNSPLYKVLNNVN